MNWRKEHHAEQSFNERHPQFENQTNLMKNIVQTESGEIVEIINGVLTCKHTGKNWITISEWCLIASESWDIKIDIRIEDTIMFVETPSFVPTHRLESLLEAFQYQSIK